MNQKVLLLSIFFSSILLITSDLYSSNKKKPAKVAISQNTTLLDKDSFSEKICDYKSNPTEWKYLGDKPAIIDFYADWCGPCKVIAPRLEDVAAEYIDSIYVYKVNIDEQPELAAMFNIRSIPTLLFIPLVDNPQITQGVLPKETLVEAVKSVLLRTDTIEDEEIDTVDETIDNSTAEEVESLDIEIEETETPNENIMATKETSKNGFKRSKANIKDFKQK